MKNIKIDVLHIIDYIYKMESIVNFTLPNVKCTVSLNPRGRRKYVQLETFLKINEGSQSTVGTVNGDSIDQNLRKSKHHKAIVEFNMDREPIETHLKRLGTTDKIPYIQWPKSCTIYDIITYETGDFFVEHSDTKMHKLHYATLLVFPPATNEFIHTGGNLIIKRPDNTEFIFDSSVNTQWTAIAFHTGLKHECKPVISGKRVAMKTELRYSSKEAIKNDIIEEPTHSPVCDGCLPVWND